MTRDEHLDLLHEKKDALENAFIHVEYVFADMGDLSEEDKNENADVFSMAEELLELLGKRIEMLEESIGVMDRQEEEELIRDSLNW